MPAVLVMLAKVHLRTGMIGHDFINFWLINLTLGPFQRDPFSPFSVLIGQLQWTTDPYVCEEKGRPSESAVDFANEQRASAAPGALLVKRREAVLDPAVCRNPKKAMAPGWQSTLGSLGSFG